MPVLSNTLRCAAFCLAALLQLAAAWALQAAAPSPPSNLAATPHPPGDDCELHPRGVC